MALAKVLKVAAAACVLSIAAFPVISIITKEKVRLEADVYPGEVFKPFSVEGDRLRSRIEGWGEATLPGTFKPIEVLGRAESLERVILSNLGTDPARDIRVR
ncbi:MAG: hypothetical protein K2Q10_13665, partial [Rhodospirillales bacterium]|nr:hypothetical protein [Rhodospirillales bacterium]